MIPLPPSLSLSFSASYLEIKLDLHVFSEAGGIIITDGGGVPESLQNGIGEDKAVANNIGYIFVRGVESQKLQHLLG